MTGGAERNDGAMPQDAAAELFDGPEGAGAASGGTAGGAAAGKGGRKPRKPRKPAARKGAAKMRPQDAGLWTRRAWGLLLLVFLVREAVNLAPVIPVHFDEAQYWVYARHFDFGYFSKPPLAAWMIRAGVELFGDDLFGLRVFAPLSHLVIGGLIFAIGARLYEARLGFWAAALYTAAPGVSLSSMLMTTDPPMMMGWALALYAYVRAVEPVKEGRKILPAPPRPGWWLLVGLGIGLGMMAKYTAIACLGGIAGHLIFSAAPRPEGLRRGLKIAAATAVAALAPNLVWNAMHGFATVAHLGDNVDTGVSGPMLRPEKLAEFLGAQFGVIGPTVAAACFAALATLPFRRALRTDAGLRLLAWFAAPLLLAMCVQAATSGANANWGAPAFVSGAVIAARMVERWGAAWARWLQLGLGAAAVAALVGLGAVYAAAGDGLPRLYDPFKKMRVGGPFCEIALAAMEDEAADALLTDDRRRLSECMFLGDLRMQDVGFLDLNHHVDNHYDIAAKLRPGDDRVFVMALESQKLAEDLAAKFDSAEFLGEGAFPTHADRSFTWSLWLVQGWRGE